MNQHIQEMQNYLDDTKLHYDKYFKEKDEIKKQKILKNFLNEIIQFLDYSITGFPTDRKFVKDKYFPRKELGQNEKEFKKFLQKGKVPKKLSRYLTFCYRVNHKYQNSIYYIPGSFKHRSGTTNLLETDEIKFSAQFSSTFGNTISINPKDESLEISGFLKANKGSSVTIKNSCFSGPSGSTIIDSLEYGIEKKVGNKIRIGGQELEYGPFGQNCILALEEIFDFYLNNYSQDTENQMIK